MDFLAIVKLSERDGHLSVDSNGNVAFVLPQHAQPTVFTLTNQGDAVTLREQGGQQRYFVPAAQGVCMASLPQQWDALGQQDGTLLLVAGSGLYLSCDATGLVSLVNNMDHACHLLIQEYSHRPTWLLRPRDALEAYETQQLQELLKTTRATLASQSEQIELLQRKQVQIGSGTSAYPPRDHYMLTGNGAREFRQVVEFPRPFAAIPQVAVAITCLDVDCHQNTRVDLRAENATTTNFTLVIATWADTRLYLVRFSYIAVTVQPV